MDIESNYVGHIPYTLGEIWDLLGAMMLEAPTFKDDFFVHKSVDTVFHQLDEGLKNVRPKLGEERYAALAERSARMKALFEADPKDETGETTLGRRILNEMEDLLRRPTKRR